MVWFDQVKSDPAGQLCSGTPWLPWNAGVLYYADFIGTVHCRQGLGVLYRADEGSAPEKEEQGLITAK